MIDAIYQGLTNAFALEAIIANALGSLLGIIFGTLPGLTATMGIALLIPMTFGLSPIVAFSAMLGVYCGGVYAGSITAILVATPGTATAAATLLEGPKLTQKGLAGKAISLTTIGSFIGGILSCITLSLIAPQLAKMALSFGPPEYFALGIFGLSVVSGISNGNILKGIIAAAAGLFIASIGQDPITGVVRIPFECADLIAGIAFVPALIGLFAVYQVMIKLEDKHSSENFRDIKTSGFISLKELAQNTWNFIRSSVIGIFIGIVPAAGGGIAAFIAYSKAKQSSKTPEKFGTGHLEGLAATETANNASTGGALIPTLTLGIPGDMVTAVIIGGLMVQGLTPGPLLFRDHPDTVYGLFFAFFLANIFMLAWGLALTKVFTKIIEIPSNILMPTIIMMCVVGAFSIGNNPFDVLTMFAFGLLGYIMIKLEYPLAPMLLALILSPMVESNFRRAMIMSQGEFSIFITRPICAAVLLLALLMIIKNLYDEKKIAQKNQ